MDALLLKIVNQANNNFNRSNDCQFSEQINLTACQSTGLPSGDISLYNSKTYRQWAKPSELLLKLFACQQGLPEVDKKD